MLSRRIVMVVALVWCSTFLWVWAAAASTADFWVDLRFSIKVVDPWGNEFYPMENLEPNGTWANDTSIRGHAYSPLEHYGDYASAKKNGSQTPTVSLFYQGGPWLTRMEAQNSYESGDRPLLFPDDQLPPVPGWMYGRLEGKGPEGPGYPGYLVETVEHTITLSFGGFSGWNKLVLDVAHNYQTTLTQEQENPFTRINWTAGFNISTDGGLNYNYPIVTTSLYSRTGLGDILEQPFPQLDWFGKDFFFLKESPSDHPQTFYINFIMRQEGYTADPIVPVPGSLLLLGSGLLGLGAIGWGRRKR